MVEKKKKEYKVVLGALYGDEGKGSTVQWLCKEELDKGKKPVVVRFSGGPQAGHTVMQRVGDKDLKHICASLGSGVLLGVDTYLDESFMLDPIALVTEIDALLIELADAGSPLGKEFHPKVWINEWCRIITPYDVMSGRKDQKVMSDGTCGKGIYSTFKRCKESFGVNPVAKVFMHSQENKVSEVIENPQKYLDRVKLYYNIGEESKDDVEWTMKDDYQVVTQDELDWKFCDAMKRIERLMKKDFIKVRNEDFMRSGLYDTIIYEGSQGLLLDMDYGFMPNCTPSRVGLNGLPKYITSSKETEVFLVMRTYLTRHGQGVNERYRINIPGPYMSRVLDTKDRWETNDLNQWQKMFIKGLFDINLLDKAFDRHALDNYPVRYNLVVTHADLIDKFIKNRHCFIEEAGDRQGGYGYTFNPGYNDSQDKLWSLVMCDGTEGQVVNIAEFISKIKSTGQSPYYGKGFNWMCPIRFFDAWYSDNPYSEFKKVY
jgi:adenylosuccinate synthase